METDDPTDDILCECASGRRAWVQAKHDVTVGTAGGGLAPILVQWAEMIRRGSVQHGDGLVLAVARLPGPLEVLRSALNRRRDPHSGALTAKQHKALQVLTTQLVRVAPDLDEDAKRQLFDAAVIWHVGAGDAENAKIGKPVHGREAQLGAALLGAVLADAKVAPQAMAELTAAARTFASRRSGADIATWRVVLQAAGFELTGEAAHQSSGDAVAQQLATREAAIEVQPGPGQLVSEVHDPFALEVHEAIRAPVITSPLARLPIYIRRQHDGDLEKVVDLALAGQSEIAVLLGNSSTGKTRSAWEQIQRLPTPWRLWHPAFPDELLAKLSGITPHTVLWLNELHRYICTDDIRRDETIAGRLLEMLRDSSRAPVLILGTLWHEYRLRVAPAESLNDVRPQVRALVSEHFIPVPETFGQTELQLLADAASQDPRLAEAQTKAEQGHITQYLAGGPAQVERYLTADPSARAVLHAAMDARRLGWGPTLPTAFLVHAAQAYLTELQQDNLPGDWFDRALGYLLPMCRGARGPLSRVRAEPRAASEAGYKLVDYLEQYGKQNRSELCPPDQFWLAALCGDVASRDQAAMARAAYERDRIEAAHQLASAAAAGGNAAGVAAFAALIDRDEDREAALPYFRRAAENGDARSQVTVGVWHEDKGEWDTAEAWYARANDGKNPLALVGLASLESLRGHPEKAEQLYEQALSAGGAKAVEHQARHLATQGAHDLALSLADRSYANGNTEALTGLAWTYISTDADRAFAVMEHALKLGFRGAINELIILATTTKNRELTVAYCHLAEQLGNPDGLRVAGTILLRDGAERRGAGLLWRAFNGGVPWALFELGTLREKQGCTRKARRIYRRLAMMGETYAIVELAKSYERAGDHATAEKLAEEFERDPHPGGGDAGWEAIAEIRQERGDFRGAEALLQRLVAAGKKRALTMISDVRLGAGDTAGAIDILRRAIDSGVPSAKTSLAKLEATANDIG
ncbi:hypothetical protein ACLQ28_03805 [Micromonospora sp. DT201]|uniref:tetratricopeptide repeat protein n=1 Tax=Micromonospora sp. DT201 TaxID=3393442 RepID=UPI003CE6FA46